MKYSSLLFLVIILYGVDASVFYANAPVRDPDLVKQGYSCQTDLYDIGPMKQKEKNNNYSPLICGSVVCGRGIIHFYSCGVSAVENGCKLKKEDPSKPYPECCEAPEC